MTVFPPDPLDFVVGSRPDRKTDRMYVQVDGELVNIFREHRFGVDFCRLFITRALKEKYGEALYIHIVKASTGRHIPELPRTRGQIRRERRAAARYGFDWAPPAPGDEGANPVVVIGQGP